MMPPNFMEPKMKIMHDQHIAVLVKILKESNQYYIIQTNIQYGTPSEIIGEIDVLGIGFNIFDIYEVKGNADNKNMRKAIYQTQLARSHIGQQGSEFIYTPAAGIESLDRVAERLSRVYKKIKR